MLLLTSSVPNLPTIFRDGLINALLNGMVVFWNAGGWVIVILAVLGVLSGLIHRKRRRY